MAYQFHDTSHVAKRARERRFTDKPARILKTPTRRGNHGGTIWLFFRAFGNRILVAVAEVKNNECWIITAYSVSYTHLTLPTTPYV